MYRRLLERGWPLIVLVFAAATAVMGAYLPRVTVDASTNLLLDEHDPDLTYYSDSRRLWPSDDEFAIVCCRRADWFTTENLADLRALEKDLAAVPHAKKVLSLMTVPLLRQTPLPIPKSLDAKDVDLVKAKDELTHHAIAKGTFISEDGKDAVLLVYLEQPPEYERLDVERNAALRTGDDARVASTDGAYEVARSELRARRRELVAGVRDVAAKWSSTMEVPIRLSGLPLINLSLIEFVTHDVNVFGVLSFVLFTLAFAAIYRRLRFTAGPIATCLLPVLLILGAMAALDLKLTVITANLPLLLFVLVLPFTVYFVQRYRERRAEFPDESHAESTAGAASDIWIPCLYSCTTTAAGFASLLTSGVKPVRWFGLMMTIGLAVGMACVFLFLPASTVRLAPIAERKKAAAARPSAFMRALERFVLGAPAVIVVAGVVLYAVSAWGVTRLTVENKFIDYFKSDSEVYRGLEYIDQHMGGTTPLDIVLTSKTPGYFKTPEGVAAIRAASDFAQTKVKEVGSVTSLATLLDEIHKAPALQKMTVESLSRVRGVEPLMLDVATPDFTTTRVLVRFRETAPTLHRKSILDGLRSYLAARPELADLSPRATGVFLLYSNMLESLLQSQKDTFWAVILAISLMLMTLFGVRRAAVQIPIAIALAIVPFFIETGLIGVFVAAAALLGLISALSLRLDERLRARGHLRAAALVHTLALSVIVHLPQILPAVVVLGVMGWTHVPLDLITVTIAAIAMGVGIDSSIQYTVRYRIEQAAVGGDSRTAITRANATIGRSIWIATSIMVVGFLVMAFSDFVPTVYFGVFNALAMVIGQFATLTVLPSLFLLTGLPRPATSPASNRVSGATPPVRRSEPASESAS